MQLETKFSSLTVIQLQEHCNLPSFLREELIQKIVQDKTSKYAGILMNFERRLLQNTEWLEHTITEFLLKKSGYQRILSNIRTSSKGFFTVADVVSSVLEDLKKERKEEKLQMEARIKETPLVDKMATTFFGEGICWPVIPERKFLITSEKILSSCRKWKIACSLFALFEGMILLLYLRNSLISSEVELWSCAIEWVGSQIFLLLCFIHIVNKQR